jgi:RNA polymerase sigma-70 factor, ECF subfamily
MTADPGFVELYEREAPSIHASVYALCRDPAVAQDATQEAFTRALERWDRLRDQPWVAGWILKTACNTSRRQLRRRPHPEPEAKEAPDLDLSLDLWRAVASLPRKQQVAVLLTYRSDLASAEAALVMGCREGTVRTHLARARAALRLDLERSLDDA